MNNKTTARNVLSKVVQGGRNVDIYTKINTVSLIVIATACITLSLIYTKSMLIPLVLSIFVYSMISPVVSFFRTKLKFPKWLAIVTASLAVLIPLVLIVISIVNSVGAFIHEMSIYQERLSDVFSRTIEFVEKYKIPVPADMFKLDNIDSFLISQSSQKFIKNMGGWLFVFVSYVVLSAIFLFFLIIGGSTTKSSNPVLKEIQNSVSAYLYIHIMMSVITAFLCWAVYVSVGLEMALMFAMLTFVLNFIPNIGSVIAVALPLPVAFLQYGISSAEFVLLLVLTTVTQFVIGSIVEPKLLGNGMDLHPVTVVCSLIFWSLVWGVAGAFLAVPITAAVRIILSKMEPTRPFAEFMSGRLPQ